MKAGSREQEDESKELDGTRIFLESTVSCLGSEILMTW